MNNLWLYLFQTLDDKDKKRQDLKDSLELICQTHGVKTIVRFPHDFKNVKNGGCMRDCSYEASCGHKCKLKCHNWSEEDGDCELHEEQFNECKLKCCRPKPCGHPCMWDCYQCKDGQYDGHRMKCSELVQTCEHEKYACHIVTSGMTFNCMKC